MANTVIATGKLAAYSATHYRYGFGDAACTLCIGEPSEDLSRIYKAVGCTGALFITACNPFGRAKSDETNEAAHARLEKRLRGMTSHVIEGAGADPGGTWPQEKNFLALGISEVTARLLGRSFQQDAVVWAGSDAVPKLLLLR